MATRLYGTSRGFTEFQITEAVGSATVAHDMELTIDTTKFPERADLVVKLNELINHILSKNWPPA